MDSSADNTPPLEDLINRNWVTLSQLCKSQSVTYFTGLRWIREKKLNAVKIGGSWRIYEDELRRFLTEGSAKR